MTVATILEEKAGGAITVTPEARIADVIDLLAEKGIGAVLVVDDAGQLRGVLSERDIMRRLATSRADTFALTVGALMTRDITVAGPETTVGEAMRLMTEKRFRHLPVLQGGTQDGALIGVVSIGDVVKALITEQTNEVESLRAYVVGTA